LVKEADMRADGHEQHALQLEHAITVLGDPAADPDIALSLIENYWAAGFHWIAYGCQQKHGHHKENSSQLSRYLRDLDQPTIGAVWDRLENRQGSMFAYHTVLDDVQQAHDDWQEIRTWALS
jgi:hypothetical protein